MVGKLTNIGQPLAPSSMHSRGVHKSWPQSLLARIARLTSSRRDTREIQQQRVDIWRSHNIFPSTDPEPPESRPVSRFRRQRTVRVVIPYHPIWGGAGLSRTIFAATHAWQRAMRHSSMQLNVGISWSLGGTHMLNAIRATSFEESLEPQEWRIFSRIRR